MSEPTFAFPQGRRRLSELTLEEARDVITMLMDAYDSQRRAFASYQELDRVTRRTDSLLERFR
jgi:hypothetical protein